MTVPATTRKAGPYTGNGVQTVYPYAFKVFATTDVKVVTADLSGVETVLSSGFTVSMNADQVASPGGNITLSAALTSGYKLTVLGALPYDQTLAIPGGGNYNPVTHENALDRLLEQIQQVKELTDRAVLVPSTSSTDPSGFIDSLFAAASAAESVAALAAAAAASLNAFVGQYYGPLAADPTLDPLGNAMGVGDLYWNTVSNTFKAYNGSSWVVFGAPADGSVTLAKLAAIYGTGPDQLVQLTAASKLPAVDGSLLTGMYEGLTTTAVISTAGASAWTIPAGVTKVKATVVGGGGNGCAQTVICAVRYAGGGGGGGGTAIKLLTGLTPGNTLTVTVGAAGNTSSVASGTQSISTVSATGGGSTAPAFFIGGAGGAGSGGDVNVDGQNGGNPSPGNATYHPGGVGGSSFLGGGAKGGSTSNGVASTSYGSGGGGPSYGGGTTYTGGAGAGGVVILEY